MPPYTLKQLRYYVAVVETGSFAEAARQVNISQPSVSTAIKNLEDSFGFQLLIRHHASGASPTPAGNRFYGHAKHLLRSARDFEQNAQGESGLVTGQIELGCFITFAPLYLPRLLAGFHELYPGITINVNEGWQTSLMDGLRGGRFDLAMMYDFDLDSTFDSVELMCNLKPEAVLAKSHHLANRESVSLQMLVAEPFVLLDVPPSGEYFRGLFAALGLTPNIAYSSPTLELVRGLVGQGLGYSVLATRPASAVTVDGNEVVTVPLSDPVRPSVLVLAWLRSVRCSRPVKAFTEYCQKVFQTIPLGR